MLIKLKKTKQDSVTVLSFSHLETSSETHFGALFDSNMGICEQDVGAVLFPVVKREAEQ